MIRRVKVWVRVSKGKRNPQAVYFKDPRGWPRTLGYHRQMRVGTLSFDEDKVAPGYKPKTQ